jgi:hypothetical protein
MTGNALKQLASHNPLHDLDLFCEVRLGLLATQLGLSIAAYPVHHRGIQGKQLPFREIRGEGIWHQVKHRFAAPPAADCPVIGTWLGQHPHWTATLELRADGQIIGDGLDSGCWNYFPDRELILAWDNYPSVGLTFSICAYTTNDGFTLKRVPAFTGFQCKVTGSMPFIIHANGDAKNMRSPWWALAQLQWKKFDIEVPDSIAIVTWSNYAQSTALENQLLHAGVKHHVLSRNRKEFRFCHKITDLLPFLQTCDKEYVLCIDSNDVLFVGAGSLTTALAEMKSRNCQILFGGEVGNWPTTHAKFEKQHSDTCFCHLNAGVMLGRTTELKCLLEKYGPCNVPDPLGGDQAYYKNLYAAEYPKLQLDTRAKYFLNLYKMPDDALNLI